MNILIIDQDSEQRQQMLAYLQDQGDNVVIYDNAIDAWRYLRRIPPINLIILELDLPGVNGYQLIDKIKADSHLHQIPCVIYSRFSRSEDIAQAIKLGAIDYISKRNQFKQVIASIEDSKKLVNIVSELVSEKYYLSGTIQEISILEILQIIQLSQKSGKMTLSDDADTGFIYVSKGQLHRVEYQNLDATPALYSLLNWKQGKYFFQQEPVKAVEKNIHISMSNLLLNGTKFLDELEDLLEKIPIRLQDAFSESPNIKSHFYFNLIHHQYTIRKLVSLYNLSKIDAGYHFLKLEKEKKCKLIDKNTIPQKNTYSSLNKSKLNILVIDDSQLITMAIESLMIEAPFVEKLESICNIQDAKSTIERFQPDVIALGMKDVKDPESIHLIQEQTKDAPYPFLVFSDHYPNAFEALRCGAINFQNKKGLIELQYFNQYQREINNNIKALSRINLKEWHSPVSWNRRKSPPSSPSYAQNVVILGANHDSIGALLQIMLNLPGNLNAAVVIVHYLAPDLLSSLLAYLKNNGELHVNAFESGTILRNSTCYFSDAQHFLQFSSSAKGITGEVTPSVSDSPPHGIDVAMFSAAEVVSNNCTGLIISGHPNDGVEGLREIKKKNGYTIVQRPDTCVDPAASITALNEDAVIEMIPIKNIASKMSRHV